MTGTFLRLDQINPSLFDSLIRRSRTDDQSDSDRRRPPEGVSSTPPISGLMAPDTDFAQVSINEEDGPVSTSDNILTRAATALGAFSTDPDRVADAIIPRQENPPQIDLGEWETMRPVEETLDLSRAAAIDSTLQSMNRDAAGIRESLYPSVTDADPFEAYYRSDVGPTRTTVPYSYNNTPLVEGGLRGNSRRGGDAPKEVQREVMQRIIEVGRSAGMSDEDVALTLAIASHESGFNPDAATGSSSASGLGQFVNRTAKSYGITDENRWDVDAQVRALVGLTQDNIARVNRTNRSRDYVYALHHDGPSLNSGGLGIGRENVNPLVPGFLELVRSVPRRDDYGPSQAAGVFDREASELAVESSLMPQPRPVVNVPEEQIQEAETPAEVTAAVAENMPAEARINPAQYIFDQGYMGLDENNPEHQRTIQAFMNRAAGYNIVGTPNQATVQAWCAGFVDDVLVNLGAPRADEFEALVDANDDGIPDAGAVQRVRAAEYQNYGSAVDGLENATAGDIIVIKPPNSSQWHVGFYVGTSEVVSTNREQLRSVQEALIANGHAMESGADGLMGGQTRAALTAYQKSQGLRETGVLDAQTYTSLMGTEPENVTQRALVLGGNQSNEVNVTPYSLNSVQAIRRIENVAELDTDTLKEITTGFTMGAADGSRRQDTNMLGLPLELVTMLGSTVLGGVMSMWGQSMKAKQQQNEMLLQRADFAAKQVNEARNAGSKDRHFAWTRRLIALSAVFSIIVLPKLVAVWYPEVSVFVGYTEVQSNFFTNFFGGEGQEVIKWQTANGFVITPLDTHIVSAIVGLYFGAGFTK